MDHRPRILAQQVFVSDITRGTFQALRHASRRAASTKLLPRKGSILFRSVEKFIHLPTDFPFPCWPASPLRVLFTCI